VDGWVEKRGKGTRDVQDCPGENSHWIFRLPNVRDGSHMGAEAAVIRETLRRGLGRW
jgi:hypothetical protein